MTHPAECCPVAVRRTRRVSRLFRALRQMFALKKQRSDLGRLDDAALRDIGLDRDTAEREARRPPWDVPKGWRR